MNKPLVNLELLNDAKVFEAIHDAKRQFKDLFISISNELDNSKLNSLYPSHKGVKISMGNELHKCPYQVLDIFRNFDKKNGHNVRILNWWGHGLYIFVFFGKELARETLEDQEYFENLDFRLAAGSSPWDYAAILNHHTEEGSSVDKHLSQFGYLMWYKEIQLEADSFNLQMKITDLLTQIFHFHRI